MEKKKKKKSKIEKKKKKKNNLSLKLNESIVNVSVIGYSKWNNPNTTDDFYYTFSIVVQTNLQRYMIEKLANDFITLQKDLQQKYGTVHIPKLSFDHNLSLTLMKDIFEDFLQKIIFFLPQKKDDHSDEIIQKFFFQKKI